MWLATGLTLLNCHVLLADCFTRPFLIGRFLSSVCLILLDPWFSFTCVVVECLSLLLLVVVSFCCWLVLGSDSSCWCRPVSASSSSSRVDSSHSCCGIVFLTDFFTGACDDCPLSILGGLHRVLATSTEHKIVDIALPFWTFWSYSLSATVVRHPQSTVLPSYVVRPIVWAYM